MEYPSRKDSTGQVVGREDSEQEAPEANQTKKGNVMPCFSSLASSSGPARAAARSHDRNESRGSQSVPVFSAAVLPVLRHFHNE
jgi:hypothetical protein